MNVGFTLTAPTENAKTISLIKIQEGDVEFIGDLFVWASEWVKSRELGEAMVRNTHEGHYEIFVKKRSKTI